MYLVINKCVTVVKVSNFSGHYLRNGSTLDIGVLGYIGIVQHKEHSPEVLSIPPGTPCIYMYNCVCHSYSLSLFCCYHLQVVYLDKGASEIFYMLMHKYEQLLQVCYNPFSSWNYCAVALCGSSLNFWTVCIVQCTLNIWGNVWEGVLCTEIIEEHG